MYLVQIQIEEDEQGRRNVRVVAGNAAGSGLDGDMDAAKVLAALDLAEQSVYAGITFAPTSRIIPVSGVLRGGNGGHN